MKGGRDLELPIFNCFVGNAFEIARVWEAERTAWKKLWTLQGKRKWNVLTRAKLRDENQWINRKDNLLFSHPFNHKVGFRTKHKHCGLSLQILFLDTCHGLPQTVYLFSEKLWYPVCQRSLGVLLTCLCSSTSHLRLNLEDDSCNSLWECQGQGRFCRKSR